MDIYQKSLSKQQLFKLNRMQVRYTTGMNVTINQIVWKNTAFLLKKKIKILALEIWPMGCVIVKFNQVGLIMLK